MRRTVIAAVCLVLFQRLPAEPAKSIAGTTAESVPDARQELLRDWQLGALSDQPDGPARIAAIAKEWQQRCEADARADACYQAAFAHYHAASLLLAEPDQAAGHVVACAKSLAVVRRDPTLSAEGDALLAGCYGLSIALNPSKGMALGPESAQLLDKAQKSQPDSPRVLYLAATRLIRTPAIWGGDQTQGHALLERAARLIDAESPSPERPSWGKGHIERLLASLEKKAE